MQVVLLAMHCTVPLAEHLRGATESVARARFQYDGMSGLLALGPLMMQMQHQHEGYPSQMVRSRAAQALLPVGVRAKARSIHIMSPIPSIPSYIRSKGAVFHNVFKEF